MIDHNCEVDHDSVVHQRHPTEEQRTRQRAYYLANVTMIDEKIGEILKALEDNGYLENAIVIFASDHGDALTDHGHSQKWTMYDTVTRAPLIVWAPGRYAGGRKLDGLCSLMDIGPAILEMAGIQPPEKMAAKSLLTAIEGRDWEPRKYVFCEQARDVNFATSDYQTMVRGKDWKLVRFADHRDGQLFDLRNDPDEVDNLWNSPPHQERKQELINVLLSWREQSSRESTGWRTAWDGTR